MPLSIDVAPVIQTVSAGSPAFFECAANGTSVEIQWLYNGVAYTANSVFVTTSRMNSAYVRSTLELPSPSTSGSVICITRQSFDGTTLLNNDDFNNSLSDQNRRSTAELIVIPQTGMTVLVCHCV